MTPARNRGQRRIFIGGSFKVRFKGDVSVTVIELQDSAANITGVADFFPIQSPPCSPAEILFLEWVVSGSCREPQCATRDLVWKRHGLLAAFLARFHVAGSFGS
jgi:hypothetical protein